jgi:hypothetical protein
MAATLEIKNWDSELLEVTTLLKITSHVVIFEKFNETDNM